MEKPIAYVPHPVSAERKAELVAAGFKIMDIAHKPAGAKAEPVKAVVEEKIEADDAAETAEPVATVTKAATSGAKRKAK